MENRILNAAYRCFEQYGIGKSTIEDIAKAADVSRPTVYRYFSGKDDIVDSICCLEALKINAEIRKSIRHDMDFATTLTEALFIIVKLARHNKYLPTAMESVTWQAKAATKSSRIHKLNRHLWQNFMDRAAASGQLAPDIDFDEILSWLTLSQSMLQIRLSSEDLGDAELRRLIRRFFVLPLVTPLET